MIPVDVKSIQDSVQKGTLVELSSDYRSSRTVKAYLSEPSRWAMSIDAFRQHVMQGTADEKQSRLTAICMALSDALKQSGEKLQSSFEFGFKGEGGQIQRHPLKLEWFAPNQYWVILLPSEHLQMVLKPAGPA